MHLHEEEKQNTNCAKVTISVKMATSRQFQDNIRSARIKLSLHASYDSTTLSAPFDF